MNENDLNMKIGELPQSASHSPPQNDRQKELEKNRKKSLLKFIIIGIFLLIVIIIGSLGWFTQNRNVAGSGMNVVVGTDRYEISVKSQSEGGSPGIYSDQLQIVREQTNSSAIVWNMTSTAKMDNFSEPDAGIKPGSYGMITFYVTPKVATIYLKFKFEVIGYIYSESGGTATMTSLADSPENADLEKYLNGHILLFGNRSGTSPNYIYSDPILSDDDMLRLTGNKRFDGAGTRTAVTIYWVWPKTLSTLVDASSCSDVSITPFTSKVASGQETLSDYQKIVNNIIAFPDYYLKGVSRSTVLNETMIVNDYSNYGDCYDQADNDIGIRLNYILLKLSVSEDNTGGG